MSKSQDPETVTLQPQHPRNRNVFILKSLSIILTLTVIVLGINYYLILNCPETVSSQGPNAVSPRINVVELVEKRVEIRVYYEILCPDSKSFLLHNLVPAVKKYGRYLDLKLVPWGKARWSDGGGGDIQFSCQHGPEECHGNKLHACIIDSIPDQTVQMNIIACSMNKYKLWGATINDITQVTNECRKTYAPNDTNPVLCHNASILLKMHGEETLSLKPSVSFIPTVSVQGSLSNQRQILRDLDSVIRKHLNL